MRRVALILALMVFCSALSPGKDSASNLFKKGVQAEARQDYEAAFTYYRQAYELKPTDVRYRVPYERTRFLAGSSMVHRAQKLRDEGKLQEALQLFEQAAGIDPSNQLAGQEIVRTQEMIAKQAGESAPGAHPKEKEEEDPLRRRLEEAQPPARLNPISNVPVEALEMTEDTKTIYETLGKLANLNVLFDPDYTSRRLPVKLRNVTLQEALDIVALESRTFWRPVTPNTIFVAQDTQAKRRELEQNAIKTFYLTNVGSATDLQDIVNTIRTVLEVQRIQQVPSQNAIVVKGTPDQLALAQKMVDDIDKGKPEVIVDVVVAQVRRDKTRNLGIVPPQTASVALQGTGTTTTTTGGTTGTTTTATNPINFNSLQHLNSTNYAVTIAPVTAQALLNDADTRILQSPQLRATNGEKATLTIADKIPIATGSFGTPVGVGTAVGAVGVNTQFNYIDVGVILEITPTIHSDGEVTLKTVLNISNVNGSSTIGGITQPIISQRKGETTMRLKDGEINLLGGILEQDYTKSINGWPFLGQVPILKYIFAQESKEVTTNEIIFLLKPHIVRAQQLSDLNRRSLDVGTGTGIDLHIAARAAENALVKSATAGSPEPGTVTPPTQNAPVAPVIRPAAPAAAPAQPPSGSNPPPAQLAPTVNPGAAATPQSGGTPIVPTAAAPAGDAGPAGNQLSLRFDPGNVSPAQGSTFALTVVLAHGQDISSVPIQIAYDPKMVQFMSVTNGDYLAKDGQPVSLQHRDDAANGRLVISAQRPLGAQGVSGDGAVFYLTFMAKAKGAGVVSIAVAGARNSQNQPLVVAGSQASITVN
ncbi:MAG TPA: cohesin domain-containing protein [Candidatus Angelobacter sp.]